MHSSACCCRRQPRTEAREGLSLTVSQTRPTHTTHTGGRHAASPPALQNRVRLRRLASIRSYGSIQAHSLTTDGSLLPAPPDSVHQSL
jgi:hypothetical protein